MFIRQCYRSKNGKRHAYWALVESYRTERGPRQRIVSYLGEMAAQGRLGIRQAATGQGMQYQHQLFNDVAPRWVEVDTSRIWVERCVDFGGPWLGFELLKHLGIESLLKQFAVQIASNDWDTVHEGLEVQRCPSPAGDETFILCRSQDRRKKEQAMHERFEKRIEEGPKKIEAAWSKRKWDADTIAKRVGRLLGQNSRAAGLCETDVIKGAEGRTKLVWHKVEAWRNWAALSEGGYLLRTNIHNWNGEELWKAYIQSTEAEAAFRIHKSDLKIRPVWHQKTERVQSHIMVCFLAYVPWKTLAQMCKAAGMGDEPRRVFEELAGINAVDVVLPLRSGGHIRRRCVCQPTDHQAILLQRLGLSLPKNLPLDGKFLKPM
jgi:hypothetical protein